MPPDKKYKVCQKTAWEDYYLEKMIRTELHAIIDNITPSDTEAEYPDFDHESSQSTDQDNETQPNEIVTEVGVLQNSSDREIDLRDDEGK